jgi:hypothetical protein
MVDLLTCIGILLGPTKRSLHRDVAVRHDATLARFGPAMFADSKSNRLACAIRDRLMMRLNMSPMIATGRSPYRPTWALKRELFAILDAGNDH